MIGHQYGPNPIEMEDTYLRLDSALSQFLTYMDERYGKEGYLLFFTADHGVNNALGYLKDHRIPTGAVNLDSVLNEITMEIQKKYETSDLILAESNGQIYLNYEALVEHNLSKQEVASVIVQRLEPVPGIAHAIFGAELSEISLPQRIKSRYVNGLNPDRSGDIAVVTATGWRLGSMLRDDHGTWHPYDAHIPLVCG